MKTVIDYQRRKLMLIDTAVHTRTPDNLNNSEHRELPKSDNNNESLEICEMTDDQMNENVALQRRTESLISIPISDRKEEEITFVSAQKITKIILCSNTINNVNKRNVFIAMNNPTGHSSGRDLISSPKSL